MTMPASAGPQPPGTRMTFLGHASTVIEMDGVRLVTDPVLRRLVGPLYRRVPRPLTGPLVDPDAILISHLHLDHYDPRSLRLFRRDTPVFAPVGAGLSLRWRGFKDIHEVTPGERLRVGPLEVVATDARHRGTRHPLAARTPSLGYVVSGSHSRVLRRRHGVLLRHRGRVAGAARPRAAAHRRHRAAHARVQAHEPAARGPGHGTAAAAPRRAHPLGHLPPAGDRPVPLRPGLPPTGAVPLHGAGRGARARRAHRHAAPGRDPLPAGDADRPRGPRRGRLAAAAPGASGPPSSRGPASPEASSRATQAPPRRRSRVRFRAASRRGVWRWGPPG